MQPDGAFSQLNLSHCCPQDILKHATEDVRMLSASDEKQGPLAREARDAAYACGAALLVGTQENEKLFAVPFRTKGSTTGEPDNDVC